MFYILFGVCFGRFTEIYTKDSIIVTSWFYCALFAIFLIAVEIYCNNGTVVVVDKVIVLHWLSLQRPNGQLFNNCIMLSY